jgi:hypothetical protein
MIKYLTKMNSVMCLGLMLQAMPVSANSLALEYVNAVDNHDLKALLKLQTPIKEDAKAQEYLKTNYSSYFSYFSLQSLSSRIQALRAAYGNPLPATTSGERAAASSEKGIRTNRDIAENRSNTGGRFIAQRNFISNNDSVRRYSNADRESNQERIQRRVGSGR